jgi:hypothetical protein
MTLRFQKQDEIDWEVKRKEGASIWLICGIGLLLYLASKVLPYGFWRPYAGPIAFLLMLWFLSRMVFHVYHEFRSRIKEIDGKVSAIEVAVIASKKDHAELLEKLHGIDERLAEIMTRIGRNP